jgi:SRP54-type protein, GTPase domain
MDLAVGERRHSAVTPVHHLLQVLLAAGDTFRAAAAEQLQTWAERAGAEFFGPQRDKQRPDALLYQARTPDRCSCLLLPSHLGPCEAWRRGSCQQCLLQLSPCPGEVYWRRN